MKDRWQRSVPIYGVPIFTKPFYVLGVIVMIAAVLVGYREVVGLGPTSGMNDAYSWGIWKTFNVMVLTGLGSGGFAIGIAAWVFNKKSFHTVMRMALLTSFLSYASGMMLLAIDVGRPWNLYWMMFPWKWNGHSPLLEVMVCMSAYATIPLFLENIPPMLERAYYTRPDKRELVEKAEKIIAKFYPYVVGLAYALPMMHQSSLGALMLLAGERVHPLWQTPFLPLLYVWAASYMGFAAVTGTILLCCLVWHRAIDKKVLAQLCTVEAWLIGTWTAFRVVDLLLRGRMGMMFAFDRFAGLFWVETALAVGGLYMLTQAIKTRKAGLMFTANVVTATAGMLYRFNPAGFAFIARPGSMYFPSFIEIVISLGFLAAAIMGYLYAVKTFAILPAPISEWHGMASDSRFVDFAQPEVEAAFAAAQD